MARGGCGHVDAVHAAGARRLGGQRVAGRLEGGDAVVAGQDVVQQQLDLLLVGEAVQRAGLELGEGVVVGREEGEAVVRVLELAGQLLGDPGGLPEPEQRRVLPATFKDAGQVELAGWGWTWSWSDDVVGSRSEEEREEEEKGEGGVSVTGHLRCALVMKLGTLWN